MPVFTRMVVDLLDNWVMFGSNQIIHTHIIITTVKNAWIDTL